MTVRELFSMCNIDYPNIQIYDDELTLIWEKPANTVFVKCPYLNATVSWISDIGISLINIKIDV